MSGAGLQRDGRTTIPQVAGVVDISRDVAQANAINARTAAGVTDAADQLGGIINREATARSEEAGRIAGASDELVRDEDGRLVAPELRRGAFETVAQSRHREILTNRYASEFVLESQDRVLALRRENANDPTAFRTAAAEYVQGTLAAMPPALRPQVGEGLSRLVGQHASAISQERMVRDREDARRVSETVATRLGGEIHDLAVQGRDPSEAVARFTAHVGRDTGNIWTAGEAEALTRRFAVIAPIQANLVRNIGSSGTAITALRAGPGTPGWNPAWNALTPAERGEMAQFAGAVVSARRSDISWGEGRQARSVSLANADDANALAQMEGRRLQTGTLSSDDTILRGQILERMRVRSAAAGSGAGAEATLTASGRDRAAEDRAGQRALTEFQGVRALTALGVDPTTGLGGSEATQTLIRGLQERNVPLAGQVAILTQHAADTAAAGTQQRQLAEAEQRFAAAMAPGAAQRTRVGNDEAMQNIAMAFIQRNGGGDLSSAAAIDPIVQAARAGVMPQQVASFITSAPQGSPQQFRAAVEIVNALQQNPGSRMMLAGIDQPTRQAMLDVRSQLQGLPRDGAEQRISLMQQNALRMQRGEGAQTRAELTATLGGTETAQRSALEGIVTAAARDALGGDVALPPALREQISERFFGLWFHTGNRDAAAQQAATEAIAENGWALSSNGIPEGIALQGLVPRNSTFMNVPVGAIRDYVGGPQPRLMQHAPERYTLPEGILGREGTGWQQELVRDVARAHRPAIANTTGYQGPWELGVTAFLRPTNEMVRVSVPDGNGGTTQQMVRGYELWGPTAPGVRGPMTARDGTGVATGAPLLIPLEAEHARRRDQLATEQRQAQQGTRVLRDQIESNREVLQTRRGAPNPLGTRPEPTPRGTR